MIDTELTIFVLSSDSDSDASDDGKSSRKVTQKAKSTLVNGLGTPLRKSSNAATTAVEGANNYTAVIQAKTRKSSENLSSAFKSGASDIRDEVRGEIQDAATEVNSFWVKTRRSIRQSVRRCEDQAKKVVLRSRNYLSDSTNLTAIFLILEASILVNNVIPTTTIELGHKSIKNFIKSGGKSASGTIPHVALSTPNFWALLSYAFWRPIVLWSFWTVAIPLLVAHIITFERKHEPSAVTFNLTRLAILSSVTRAAFSNSQGVPQVVGVVAGEIRQASTSWFGSLHSQVTSHFSYDFVAPFVSPELQLLLTALATAFATYEIIAHRPRSSALA